jgi:hypothetical protein
MISVQTKIPVNSGREYRWIRRAAPRRPQGEAMGRQSVIFWYTPTRLDHDSTNNQRWMYRLQSRFHEHPVWELTCFGFDLHSPQSGRIQVLSGRFECGVHGVPHTSESGQVPQLKKVLTKELSRAKLKLTPLVDRHLSPANQRAAFTTTSNSSL